MEIPYVYRMKTFKDTLEALEALDAESKDLLVGLGVVLLVQDNGDADWYVFGNLEKPQPADRARIISTLVAHGDKTDYTLIQLSNHANVGAICSGTLDQIVTGLRAVGNVNKRIGYEISSALTNPN